MRKIIPCLLLVISSALCSTTWAQEVASTPQPGSTERKAILRALRVPVQKELKKPVRLKVAHLKVQNEWAFLRGVPQQSGGKPMNYKGTPYQKAIKLGVFDDWICALLRKQRGKWGVVTYVIGATDVAYDGWDKQYQAPASIFK